MVTMTGLQTHSMFWLLYTTLPLTTQLARFLIHLSTASIAVGGLCLMYWLVVVLIRLQIHFIFWLLHMTLTLNTQLVVV